MEMRVLSRIALAWIRDRRQFNRRQLPRICPICGYRGYFLSAGRPPRWNARCPRCDSRERHRLAYLLYRDIGLFNDAALRILHFAPEPFMSALISDGANYTPVDPKMRAVTRTEDIRAISEPEASMDVVIAHHVLEHVDDDRKALAEIYRVLKPGGRAILSVPINWSRAETFESDTFRKPAERAAAYGAIDHLRYYGRDFPDRLRRSGFDVREYRATPDHEVVYGLGHDEAIYLGTKP
jgi:SAM-dependent methyltransferase